MDEKTQHGYLIIADISGFTSYLAQVELEHAHEILTDMLETIVKEFKTLLTISKLEGDAVFAFVPETQIPDGERILELVENTYFARLISFFSNTLVSLIVSMSCEYLSCEQKYPKSIVK